MIIPVYNQAQFISAALVSILNQTVKADEIIVVNDGSTDNLSAALAPFQKSITLIHFETNKGVAAARNEGIIAATGSIILFQDADDVAMPQRIESSKEALSADDVHLVLGMVKPFQDGPTTVANKSAGFIDKNPSFVLGTMAIGFKKKVFTVAGKFNTSVKVGSDLDWFVRVKKNGFAIQKINEVFIERRWHANNLSKISKEEEIKLRLKMFRKNISK